MAVNPDERPPWDHASGTTLTALLQVADGAGGGTCEWQKGELDPSASEALAAAAWKVAEAGVRARCAGAAQAFTAWRRRACGGAPLTSRERETLIAFVAPGFGLPEAVRSADHVEGHVAELAWYIVTLERQDGGRQLRAIEPPSFYVSAPGGDGLVVYERSGELIFRLWEIKKHTGTGHLSGATGRAYKQLNKHAPRYLAQYTAAGSNYPSPVGELYAQLVELWLDGAATAGAGVAIATSRSHSPPRRCFSTMDQHLPALSRPGQLEGLVAAIGDFPAFALKVRAFVWNGLST